MPKRADSQVRVLGSVVPTGIARAALVVPSSVGPVRLELSSFFVPMVQIEVPFLILGRNPLFEQFEVRIQEWRRRFGLVRRSRSLARQSDSADFRGLALVGPRKARHGAKGRGKKGPSVEASKFGALQKVASERPISNRQIAAGIRQAKRASASIDLSGLPLFHGDANTGRDHDKILGEALSRKLRLPKKPRR